MRISDVSPAHVMAARRELARRSLADFSCMVDIPTVPISDAAEEDSFSAIRLNKLASHHALLLQKLQELAEGKIPNLMVLMPPGSAKSIYCDVVFIPWFMAFRPRAPVILASYATTIAEKQGRRARQLINSKAFFNLTGQTLKADQKAAALWAMSNDSEFMAGGIRSGLTGNRAALGIIDDPIQGRGEAESETVRNSTWDAYTDDFCSRLRPGAPQVMILTRWHEGDPAGRILPIGWDGQSGWFDGRDRRKWHVLCLPAIADRTDDPLGRKLGETLWPEWFSHEHWAPFQANARTWASLYQQKPSPETGTFFQRHWFKRFRKGDEPRVLNIYFTSDHAPGGEADSDFNCLRVWGVAADRDIYCLGGVSMQETMDKFMVQVVGNKEKRKADDPLVEGLIRRWNPYCWFPEADNNWKAVAGYVKIGMEDQNAYCRIEPMSPHGGDKKAKSQAFQGMASSGKVWIMEGPEGDAIIDQLVKFPGGANDEEVDAAGIIGRAIYDAHPAIIQNAPPKAKGDRWERAFDGDDDADGWKVS